MPSAIGKYLGLVLLLGWLIAPPAQSLVCAEELVIGQRVAVVRDRTPISAGAETVDVVDRGDILTVANIKQGWVLVGRGRSGWIDRAAVMSVEGALAEFNKLVAQNPLDAGARAGRAAIWAEQRFWDAAIDESTESLRQNPRLLTAWCVRCVAHRNKRAFDAAQADADAAMALAPGLTHGFVAAGDTLRDQCFYSRAVAAYTQALERDRGNAHAMLRRGQARLGTQQSDQWQQAVSDFREALALAEHDRACQHECQVARAQAYLKLEDYGRAAAEYTDLQNQNSEDVQAMIGRGMVYGYQRQYELAIPMLTKAINLEPQNPLTYLARAEIRSRQYNTRGALQDIDEVLRLDPLSAAAYRIRGEALVKQKKWKSALEAFDKALALEPNSAATYLARARAADAKKDTATAAADRQRAAAIDAPVPSGQLTGGQLQSPTSVAGREAPRW